MSWFPELDPAAVDPPLRTWSWSLLAVALLGLALRAAHLDRLRGSPFFAALQLDARAYDAWAQRIAAGAVVDAHAFFVDPLYAYVLAGLYRLVGHDLFWPRVLNALLGIATALLTGLCAWQVWSSRLAASAAALLAAVFVPAIHFEAQVEKTALSIFLLILALVLFLRGSSRALLAAGATLGLCVLARGNTLALVPLAGLALALGWDREPGDPLTATRRLRWLRAARLLGCALPIIALATVHNFVASRELVLTTTNLGINLYLGNHDDNLHGYYQAPSFLTPSTETEVPDFRAEAQRRTGKLLDDRALSDYWSSQSWDALRARPGLALARVLHKLRLALHDDESPDSEGVELVALWSAVLRAPALWFGQLFVLATLGAVVGARRRSVRIVLVVAGVYLATLLPFFVMARLRVPLAPLLAVLAGGALAWLAAQLLARDRRSLLAAASVMAIAALVTYQRPDWMAERRQSALAIGWHNLGASLQARGREAEAVRAYERAVATDAHAVPASLRTLGQYYQTHGDYRRAERALRQVVELKPDSPSARRALNALYDMLLRDPQQVSLALELLQAAVRTGPYDEGLHYALGEAMARHASGDQVIAFFSSELAHDEKPQTSHYYWAIGLEKNGDVAGAIARLQRALEIDPAHELSQQRWGLLLERQGQLAAALAHFEEAARIHPDFADALRDAERVARALGRDAEADAFAQRAARADPRSPRRFLHWARYLHAHGRTAAALDEVKRMLAERPGDGEALALQRELSGESKSDKASAKSGSGDRSGSEGGGWMLSEDARTAFGNALAGAPAGSTAWLRHDARDPSALTFARELAEVFAQAGWKVEPISPIEFGIRPGLFFFAADDPPDASAAKVQRALAAARLEATIGSGYRAYALERRSADAHWAGFQLAEDQTFVLAIGRAP